MKRTYSFPKKTILACLIVCTSASHSKPGIEWIIEAGPSWFNLPKTTISPTDIETDNLSQGHANTTGELGLEVYYKRPFLVNDSVWFNAFAIGLAIRYSGFSDNILEGDVYQFEQSNLDNYRYQLYFENTRLLAQLSVDVITYKQVSLYLKGGIGEGWSRLRYHDCPNEEDLGGGLSLYPKNSSHFVADVGTGINYHYTERLSYSLSYLYTNYGHIAASNHGHLNKQPVTISPPTFSIDSHALLVGIHYLI
ncbi:outer membrane beta-barrel protein [Legionella sp. PATHC038]|uniref:outer membrane protein n=1 Tax=Legionella sheltonii TaxID=2992041 RepID=UPI0022442256|nr:outer membrane beta-barrel protein [Legionella sp. PATHC038]MCW8397824.1 outer membrane beta-barrel protein [Legionella sp. PATHC038]